MGKETDLIEETPSHAESKIVMIDEMWSFINGKKRKYGSPEPLMAYHVDLLGGIGPSWQFMLQKVN